MPFTSVIQDPNIIENQQNSIFNLKNYQGYDLEIDGVKEIEYLKFLPFEIPLKAVDKKRKLIIIFVESRLLKNKQGINYSHTPEELISRLLTLKQDLHKERFDARFLEIQLMQTKPVSVDTTFRWVDFKLPVPFKVTAGTKYGLAIMGNVPVNIMQVTGSGQRDHNAISSYEKGFANPFGSIWGTNNNGAMSIYAAGSSNSESTAMPAPLSYIFGNQTIGTNTDQNDANAQSISYFTCNTSATISTIKAYISGETQGNCVAAIYSVNGSSAGNLLQQSSPVYPGGKVLLAIRQFLKTVRQSYTNLVGTILVGAFPDARITSFYPERGTRDLSGVKLEYFKEAGFIRAIAGYDIILADLDGLWRNLYQESIWLHQHEFRTNLSNVIVSSDNTKQTFKNAEIMLDQDAIPGPVMLYDTFFLQDVDWQQTTAPDGATQINFSLVEKDPETSPQNKNLPNPIATPTIKVSRINARNIAVQPPESALALDSNKKPQPTSQGFEDTDWVFDPDLERTLLIEYFDRNHAFRAGTYSTTPFSISYIECDIGPFSADQDLEGWNYPKPKYEVKDVTLLDFVRWIKRPAPFRIISTHASDSFSQLNKNNPNAAADVPIIEAECGGKPWRWIWENGQYVPSFKGELNASYYVLRTLWENKQLANLCPSLLIHDGCDVNSERNSDKKAYYENNYAPFQHAGSLLFYANQLAILCHITWWDHGALGFGEKFGCCPTAVFGDGWSGFFEKYSSMPELKRIDNYVHRKRPYEWGIQGDWTLRKYY